MPRIAVILTAALAFILFTPGSDASIPGRFVLEKVFTVSGDPSRPASWARKGNTIDVQFSRRYRSDRCIGNYRVRFVFDRDFRSLRIGRRLNVGIRKIFGTPPCGHKWSYAKVQDAGAVLPKHPSVPSAYVYNQNIKAIRFRDVRLWEGPVDATVVLEARLNKKAPYSKISLIAGDNAMHFIYRYVPGG